MQSPNGVVTADHADRLVALYRELLERSQTVLTELGDVAPLERERLMGYRDQFIRQLDYWRGVLSDADPVIKTHEA